MDIEKHGTFESLSLEKKSKQALESMREKYFELGNKLGRTNKKQKYVEYGGMKYEDSPTEIYIPFDDELHVSPEYKGRFREDDNHFLGVMKIIPGMSLTVSFDVYEKGMDGSLKSKNKILSCSISSYETSKNEKVSLNIISDDMSAKDTHIMLKRANDYLGAYFAVEQAVKKEEMLEEILIQEYLSKEGEEDPEELLIKLQG